MLVLIVDSPDGGSSRQFAMDSHTTNSNRLLDVNIEGQLETESPSAANLDETALEANPLWELTYASAISFGIDCLNTEMFWDFFLFKSQGQTRTHSRPCFDANTIIIFCFFRASRPSVDYSVLHTDMHVFPGCR